MASMIERTLQRLVENWRAAVLVFDHDRRVVYSNPAARVLFGGDLDRMSAEQRSTRWTLRDPAGRLVAADVSPSARALRGDVVIGRDYQLILADGTKHRVVIDAYPVLDERGAVVAAGCVLVEAPETPGVARYRLFEGVSSWLETAETGHASSETIAALAGAGRALAASLDDEATLSTLVHAVVPRLADLCVVRVVDDDGSVRRLNAAYSSPDLAGVVAEMEAYYASWTTPDAYGSSPSLGAVLRTGQPMLVTRVTDDWLRSVAHDGRHLTLLRRIGATSLMHVPVLVRAQAVGAITFIRISGGPYEVRHLALAEELCDRAAVALENARLFRDSERRRREAELLTDVARLLAETMDPRTAAQRIADGVKLLLEDTASAAVYSLESPEDEAYAVAISNQTGVAFTWTRHLPAGAGAVALAVAQRRTVVAPDVLMHPEIHYPPAVRARLQASEYRAIMAIPLIAHHRVLGALAVGGRTGRPFPPREIALLSGFADHAAVSFHNARLYQESERARGAAETANRTKDDFLAVLSHELRTPLTAILGWTRMLERGVLSEAKATEALRAIDRNTRLQARLINDLLDVSRIVTGKLEVERQPVELAAVVRDVVASARQDPHVRRILAEPTIDAEVGLVIGDRVRLEQALLNLLSNAAKYTPSSGRVDVTLRRVDDDIEITVSDTGEGIDPVDLPLIFERFHQSDLSRTRRHGGLGLGLTIVRHVMELHGGSVHADSAGRGHGAVFTLRLPCAQTARAEGRAPRRASTVGPEAESQPLRDLRVLFVDDNEDARTFVRAALETAGARVQVAESAQHGLELFDSATFDIVLSDIGMPDIDGYDFMGRLRSRGRGARVPAIALTAYAGSDDAHRVLAAGFQRHVAKPIDPEELVAAVRSVIEVSAA
jgi:signal transduction histidine kinase/ActR/RegA family two-component response regulator